MNNYVSSSRRNSNRRGAATVEFALIAPVFLLLVFGIIEFGRMLMVQQVLTNATREGARRATVEGVTPAEVESIVRIYLANSSVQGASITVNPNDLSVVGFGDPVVVSASVPFSEVSWLPAPWFLSGTSLSATSTMQAERLQ